MSATTSGDTPSTPAAATEYCGQCGAPAAAEKRYCVNCGFHRRNAPDPVARYLSEASAARARVAAAAALAAQQRRAPRLGARLVALLLALALLAGILIGGALGTGSAPRRSNSTAGAPRTRTAPTHGGGARTGTKLRNATGSSYLQQEQSLPNSVTP
ncbi:MAG: hypothetical protein KGL15_08155 [Acidobacteriota bacterium]|nr:hypothetical protein [Acidobacteriota bacterium]